MLDSAESRNNFLLAALPNDSMPPGLLDTLASSTDLNIALEAILIAGAFTAVVVSGATGSPLAYRNGAGS